MGREHATLDDGLTNWIRKQPLFFVATAPNDPEGHLNLSPKGARETLRVIGPTTVAYLDLTGSGIETVAHLRENGRIVLMFCAFDGPPKIVRLHGRGRHVQPGTAEFDALLGQFEPSDELLTLLRAIVVVEVTRITDSCGFVVPRMTFVEERRQLFDWAAAQERRNGEDWATAYRQANNARSVDGLPGLDLEGEELSEDEIARRSSAGRAL